MSWVPVLLQAAARPGSGLADHTAFLALRLLGIRLGGTPKNARWRVQSHIRAYQQIHKMDRSQASDNHYSSQGSRVHRGDITPFRSTRSDHYRSGYLVHRLRVLGLLPRELHRRLLRLRGAPLVQWPS